MVAIFKDKLAFDTLHILEKHGFDADEMFTVGKDIVNHIYKEIVEFNKNERIQKLIENLRFDIQGNNLILYKNKFIFKADIKQISKDEWVFSNTYRTEIEEYVSLTAGLKVDLSAMLKCPMKSKDFRKYDVFGFCSLLFTIKILKNGKIIIKSEDRNFIEKMNKPIRDYCVGKEDISVIEKIYRKDE